MRPFAAVSPGLLARLARHHVAGVRVPTTPCAQRLRPRGHTVILRLYSNKAPPAKVAEAVSKRQAGAAAKSKIIPGMKHPRAQQACPSPCGANAPPEIPERLLIYHAGTGRTTFLAMLKVTTLFIGAFFCCVAVPSYIKADKPIEETAKSKLPVLSSCIIHHHSY